MSRQDLALFVVGILLAIGIVCEAEAQEPRCDTPVIDWPTEPPERTCGGWRCLTRHAWAEQVMRPEREVTRCTRELDAESRLSAQLEAAHRAAVADAIESRQEADRMRRRRWAYVAAGVAGGVLLTAGVVYTGVQVVGAR